MAGYTNDSLINNALDAFFSDEMPFTSTGKASNGKMFRPFFELFRPHKKSTNIPLKTKTSDNCTQEDSLICLADSVSEILQISCPSIQRVDCLYTALDGTTQAVNAPYLDTIPITNTYISAFYNEDNTIFITRKIPVYMGDKRIRFDDLTVDDQVFLLGHELRHIWQYKYNRDLYYRHNARGTEILHDIAEIDADAFALLFLFSEFNTDFSLNPNDLSVTFCSIFAQVKLDNNARLDRVKELSKEYTFGNCNKITDFTAKVHIQEFDDYKRILQEKAE